MKSDRGNKDKKITGYQVDTEQYDHKADFGKQGQLHDVTVRTKKKKPGKQYPAQSSERDYYAKLVMELRTAQRETPAQEVIRYFNPANPKTRMGVKFTDDNRVASTLVYSQQSKGFRTLAQVIKEEGLAVVLKKINDGLEGKPGGYTGLGRIMILALLTSESDLHLKNIGIDDQGRFVKIDGDWTHGRLRYKERGFETGLTHKFQITAAVLRELPFLNSDSAYPYNWFDQIIRGCEQIDCDFLGGIDQAKLRQEMYQAMLDIIITPDRYFEMIYQRNSYDQNEVPSNHLELMNSRMQLMHSALQSPDFLNYIKTNKAIAGLQKLAVDAANYKLAGKESLGTQGEIAASLKNRFDQIVAMANMQPGAENWNNACMNLMDSNINSFNIHGETHLMLIAAQGNENLYGLLVKKGAKEIIDTPDNETVLSMAAQNGHEKLFNQLFHQHKKLREQKYLNAALIAAAQNGNINIVNTLLASGAANNTQDRDGSTPLMHAARAGHLDIVRLLLKDNADAMRHNKAHMNALSFAALCGHEDIVEFLLRNTGLKNQVDNAFLCACHGNNVSIINRLIKAGANIHKPNAYDQKPIHILAIAGKIDLIKNLLAQGASFDTRDMSTRTPLMSAVLTDNLKMVDFILSTPTGLATLNHVDANGDNAFTLAVAKGQWKIALRLMQVKGLNISQENNQGQTPLTLAYSKNKRVLIDDLLRLGANPNTELSAKSKETLLFIYAREDDTQRIDKLVASKANLEHRNKHGQTAIYAAIEAKQLKAVIHLLALGANVQAKDKEGVTLLAHAASLNNPAAIPHLIAAGADVNEIVPPNFTALTVAMWNGYPDCVEKLLMHGATLTNKDEVSKEVFDKTIHDLLNRDRADLVFQLLSSCKALDYDLTFSDKGHNLLQIAASTGDADLAANLVKAGVTVTDDVLQLAKDGLQYYRGDVAAYEPRTTDINQKREDYQAIVKVLTVAHHKQLTRKPEAASTGDITATLTATTQKSAAITPQQPEPFSPKASKKGSAYFDRPAAKQSSPDSQKIVIRERPNNPQEIVINERPPATTKKK